MPDTRGCANAKDLARLEREAPVGQHGACSCCGDWRPLVARIRQQELSLEKRRARIDGLEAECQRLRLALKEAQRARTHNPAPTVHRQLQLTILRARAAEQEARDLRALLTQNSAGSGAND